MTMRLYNFAFGPYPQRLNIYLQEKRTDKIAVTLYEEPNGPGNVPPAHIKALTATGSLPILLNEDGKAIGQSLAILEYIEDRIAYPDMRGSDAASKAKVRQFVYVLDEAMTFFGLWARHGSQLGQGRVYSSREVSAICAERYFAQLRLVDRMMIEAPFMAGETVTIADCVAMAMLQYADQFYGVPIPSDCARLQAWYAWFSLRASAAPPLYPETKRAKALGLMEQTGIST